MWLFSSISAPWGLVKELKNCYILYQFYRPVQKQQNNTALHIADDFLSSYLNPIQTFIHTHTHTSTLAVHRCKAEHRAASYGMNTHNPCAAHPSLWPCFNKKRINVGFALIPPRPVSPPVSLPVSLSPCLSSEHKFTLFFLSISFLYYFFFSP